MLVFFVARPKPTANNPKDTNDIPTPLIHSNGIILSYLPVFNNVAVIRMTAANIGILIKPALKVPCLVAKPIPIAIKLNDVKEIATPIIHSNGIILLYFPAPNI